MLAFCYNIGIMKKELLKWQFEDTETGEKFETVCLDQQLAYLRAWKVNKNFRLVRRK